MAVYDISGEEYNKKLAEELKKLPEFQAPEWVAFVKTGVSKQRPPFEGDFWHKRAASIIRQIYIKKIVGVSRLRTRYGGAQKRGAKPNRFKKGSGKIIRLILQQAEKAGLIEQAKGKKRGRQLTKNGIAFLESVK